MASNSNNDYLQNWEDFSSMGKTMNRYSIISWISLGVTVIGSIALFIAFIMLMMVMLSYSTTIVFGILALFFIIILFIIGIFKLIIFIQYLIQLKKIGEDTNDIDLQKTFKWELWALIITIFMWIILIPGMIILYISGALLPFNVSEIGIYGIILLYLGYIIVILLVAILIIVFKILSVLALDRWAERIKATNYRNSLAIKISEGTNLIKIGRIISIVGVPFMIIMSYMGLFALLIGNILFLIGFMRSGKGITEFFDGYGNQISIQGPTFQQSSNIPTSQQSGEFTTSPNLNSNYLGTTSNGTTTMKPQTEGFCAFCGSKLDDKNSMYCFNCGRKLL